MTPAALDAVVVGSGPNGLTAGITLAEQGLDVRVVEAADAIGGGARTAALTLPGYRHDVGSAVHPFAAGSAAFARMPLAEHGLRWVQPTLALAHPLDDGGAAVLARSLDETAAGLGHGERGYRRLIGPFVGHWSGLAGDVLVPLGSALPRHPLLSARFAARALLPLAAVARSVDGVAGRALLAGLAGHAGSPLTAPVTAGPAVMLAASAHDVGWPMPEGGAQAVSDALASYLRALGGTIVTGERVLDLAQLPSARAYLLDVTPAALVQLAGDRLPAGYRRRLARYRPGPGVLKVDFALDEPVPWAAAACRQAGTVHVGGTYEEIGGALDSLRAGQAPSRPLVVTAQPSVFDPSRAPAGKHVLWAYAHVPNGWTGDLTATIEDQIERFAPGFRDVVLARSTLPPAALEAENPNLVGGDIANGAVEGRQAVFRPVVSAAPYATPDEQIFLCSAATSPGPGVHGLCGAHAARLVLRRVFGRRIR